MRAKTRRTVKAGKGCGIAFFALFALAGLIALIGLGHVVWDDMRSQFWTPTPATIIRSEVKPSNRDYIVDLGYYFTFGGRDYTGTRLRPNHEKFDREVEAKRVQQRYRADRRVTCYVNPSNPLESYLERGSPLQFLFLLIPLVFLSVGIGGMALMRYADRPKALSERYKKISGPWGLRLFGAVFMLIGGGMTYGFGILPWMESREAQTWKEVPCRISSSSVETHHDSEGSTTYSLAIVYDYTIDGETYTGDRYDFTLGSSSNRKWRDKVVAAYPRGREAVCYVNPENPTESVLNREHSFNVFLTIPAIFFLIGLLVLANAGRMSNGGAKRALPGNGMEPQGSVGGLRGNIGDAGGPISLTPAGSSLANFLTLLAVALIWNGVIFGVLLFADTPMPVKLFVAIFGLVGLGLFAAAIHQFLSLFNPRPTVQATASAIRLGESLDVRFSFAGRTERITRLKITVKGEEVATYRRGTDTRTDRHVFHEAVLLDTRDRGLMQAGSVTVAIPTDSIHSFDAPNNKITWKLNLHGDIPRWPDVNLDFPLTVLPHQPTLMP